MHVDEYIWENFDEGNAYAKWMLMHFRLPAVNKMEFDEFIKDRELYCEYEGRVYRCTGASRMGDVWLATDYNRKTGYDLRVGVDKCSKWSPTQDVR